ncbi:MAG: hypothetical protein PHE89_07925 [Alphaproteobacteria bacterium]|nr:hypothetical protein [Alphaproteobacteria bacterium]
MKKTLVLVSGSGKYASEMVLKNQCVQEEKRSFIIACDNAEKALKLPQMIEGQYIQLVADFSSIERIIREEKIETLCCYGYTGGFPEALADELDGTKQFLYQEFDPPLEKGVYGEIELSKLKYFS